MADVLSVRDDYRAQTWAMLIQECNNSGLTKREFCRQRGISEKTYYYWLRKLRSQMADPVPGHRIETSYRCGYECGCRSASVSSVAMIDLGKVRNYYIACSYTDLRLGIDGLGTDIS